MMLLLSCPLCLSGDLWLLWDHDVQVTIEWSSQNLILASCAHKQSMLKFGLICMYGDPHHNNTTSIWDIVQTFVVKYPYLPMLCMGDLNCIRSANEKKGSRHANCRHIYDFCCMVKIVVFLIWVTMGLLILGNKHFNTNPT